MPPKKYDPNAKSEWLVYYRHPEFHRPDTFEADGEYVKLSLTGAQADDLMGWVDSVKDNLGRHEYMGMIPWKPCPEVLTTLTGEFSCPNEFGDGHAGPHMVWKD
jgi:hypothetical protein